MKKQTKIKKNKWLVSLISSILIVILVFVIHQISFKKAIEDFPVNNHDIQFEKKKNTKKVISAKTFKIFEKIQTLYFSFLAQPQALKHVFELSKENILIYRYSPNIQSELALKYLTVVKEVRVQNQRWVNAYEEQLKVIKSRYNINFKELKVENMTHKIESFNQKLNTLNRPEQLAAFVKEIFQPKTIDTELNSMVFILGKRYNGHVQSSDLLSSIDNELEILQSDFLIEAHKKNNDNLWKRFTDKIRSFFYHALPITENTMDMEMIDRINNDL